MRTVIVLGAMLAASLVLVVATNAADDAGQPKYTIKQVMKRAHKEGLMKRLAIGKGTKDEARELLQLYEALGQNPPPKGDPTSWQAKTQVLIAAAQDVVDSKPGAGASLQKAANCAQCHNMHKK